MDSEKDKERQGRTEDFNQIGEIFQGGASPGKVLWFIARGDTYPRLAVSR